MKFKLHPLVLSILGGLLPTVPLSGWSAELGQVSVTNQPGGTNLNLNAGDTVTYAPASSTGLGAINVSTTGNSVTGDHITVTAGSAAVNSVTGVTASAGGSVKLTNSIVKTLSPNYGYGLVSTGQGSSIETSGTEVSTSGYSSHGAYAKDKGKISLDGGEISVKGVVSYGVYAVDAGSEVSAKNLTIRSTGITSQPVSANNGGVVALDGATIIQSATGSGMDAMAAWGSGTTITAINTTVTSTGRGANLGSGSAFIMKGGRISTANGDAILLGPSSTANISDASLTSINGYGLNINGAGSSATLNNVDIVAGVRGSAVLAQGIWMPSVNTTLNARDFSVLTQGSDNAVGIDSRSGTATLANGSVTTLGANAHALYVSHEYGAAATLTADNVDVETFGVGAVGAMSRIGGASMTLRDSSVVTHGDSGYGLYASGTGAVLNASNTTVATEGAGASALAASNRALVALESVVLRTSGANARGIWSFITAAGANNSLSMTGGSISTQDGAALLASGGDHAFTLRNVDMVGRSGGQEDGGMFLQSRPVSVSSGGVTTVIETGVVNLDASGSRLTGDVLAQSGAVNLLLHGGTVLTGGAASSGTGRVNSLTLDASSTWNVRSDSSVGALNNSGTVAFMSPGAAGGFKTLTVNDYSGGGTLVLNTRLGDDASPTDKLVIDGGAATGDTAMRIVNAGGVGAATEHGIRVVQAINGGTTTADAFHLDPGSSGFRASAGTVALNGYDYALLRGGDGGAESDWYLSSEFVGLPVDPPEPPIEPVIHEDPSDPATPIIAPEPALPDVVAPSFKNVSPETGAYLGNRSAAITLFNHSLRDRQTARVAPGDDAEGSSLWARAQGRRDTGMTMADGKVEFDTDQTLLQLGGDLLQHRVGQDGVIYAGVMAGYGEARTDSVSTLYLPAANSTAKARADGKVTGYSMGIYGTYYANDKTRLGAFFDSWLQFGRYSNQISSELGSARYHSNVWSASIESGYAMLPFAPDAALGGMVVEPHAQLIYGHYGADDTDLQGTRLRNGSANAATSRAGVRIYPYTTQEKQQGAVRPFLEANWLHSFDDASVRMGTSTLDMTPSRNALELKVGAEGQITRSVKVSGQLFGQQGSNSQRGYGGTLNFSYLF
ncbi:autotransporter outer membrane beta-barrel domain-containing protein [Achromobacter sp. NPDC058515]|uniref:autotransporter outer membrane beta-barrel domain-containing protein n=1 Tax=Achromobacter sp. NPDC058515 TaxID=3346533 RepID=UPI00365D891A